MDYACRIDSWWGVILIKVNRHEIKAMICPLYS